MAEAEVAIPQEEQQKDSWKGGKSPFNINSQGKVMMWYFLLSDAFTFTAFLSAYGALRFSSETWPVSDFIFSTAPFGIEDSPLIFVTIMSFILIISSVTMVRAVQEGHRKNRLGTAFWLLMTIIGGLSFLGCQAWEWTGLIKHENVTVMVNPFGAHTESGVYLEGDGHDIKAGDKFVPGDTYLIHKVDGEWDPLKYKTSDGEVKVQAFGPRAFGALFFFITGFHGFHVTIGVSLLIVMLINVLNGRYERSKLGYSMVEKVGLFWHFVDLVWVFVFLAFYLL